MSLFVIPFYWRIPHNKLERAAHRITQNSVLFSFGNETVHFVIVMGR